MNSVIALSAHTGVRLAEVGFLLILFAGVWLVAAQIPQFKLPRTRTSSSFVTWCYWQAGAPDPNGSDYNGFGYLGTLATHGRRVAVPEPGDVVLYGAGSIPAIAGIYVGHGKVVVNGGEAGPDLRRIDFRSPRQIRSYEVVQRAVAG